MSEFKLTKLQRKVIDNFYHEFGVSGCVSYYSINGYLMVAVETIKDDIVFNSSRIEVAIRKYLLKKYESEVYHYIDNYEEDIKGEHIL